MFTLWMNVSNYSGKDMPNVCKKDMLRCAIYSNLTLSPPSGEQFFVKSLSFYTVFVVVLEHH